MLRATLLVLLAALAAASVQRRSDLTGDYVEQRANHVFGCYCEWSGEGETSGREAVLAWRILTGDYRGVALAGVKFVLVIQGDRTLSRPGAARRSMLLIDESATAEQAQAVETLVRRNYGDLAGSLLGVLRQPITFERTAEAASVRLGSQGEVVMRKARLPEDALPGARDWYEPFVPMTEITLGTTLAESYSGPGFGHQWARFDQGVTGYFGAFSLAAE